MKTIVDVSEEDCYRALLFLYENRIITDNEYKDLSNRYNRFLVKDFWKKAKKIESEVNHGKDNIV